MTVADVNAHNLNVANGTVTIDFKLPRLDNSPEVPQLIALGKELGKQLALERARRWIQEKVPVPLPTP